MNALAIWKATSATIEPPQRRFIATFWALMTLVSIVFLQVQGMGAVALMTYVFGMLFWWTFVAGRSLLLQRDARSLRIPGVDQAIVANLLMQYALSVLLPSALLAVAGFADFPRSVAFLSCVVAASLMFQVLPRHLGALLAVVPTGMQILHARGVIPGLSDAGFVGFGASLALAMMVVVVWRWHVALHTHPDTAISWKKPLVLQTPRQPGLASALNNWDAQMDAFGTSGLGRLALLDGVGPGSPTHALRVWLGGSFVPIGAQARMKQIAVVILPMLVVIAVTLIGPNSAAGWTVFVLFVGGLLFPLMIMSIAPARLQRLHTSASGEISLLALLPGIDATTAKRTLLAATLGLPLEALGLFYVFVVAAAMILGGDGATLLALSLGVLAAMAFAAVLSLSIVGARPVPGIAMLLVCVSGPTLLFTTPVVLLHAAGHPFDPIPLGLLVGWLTFYAALAWLLIRGYGAWLRRPHAFLLNNG